MNRVSGATLVLLEFACEDSEHSPLLYSDFGGVGGNCSDTEDISLADFFDLVPIGDETVSVEADMLLDDDRYSNFGDTGIFRDMYAGQIWNGEI